MEKSKNNKTVWILGIILILIIGIIIVSIFAKESNKLSKNDTFDTFIRLVEKEEYEEAKKYTTSNFKEDLSYINFIKISKIRKDYNANSENKYVYKTSTEAGYYKANYTYTFELKETINGWKVDSFKEEITDNSNEVYNLIH